MRRHPHLQPLSREHHHTLVLARRLRKAGELDAAGVNELAALARQAFARTIASHFLLEERELVPLAVCGSAEARARAAIVRAQHAELRTLFGRLGGSDVLDVARRLGELLREHTRLEERAWYPELEGAAEAPGFDALAWRLRREPEARIASFARDEEGVWFARLDCGHPQHVRHEPPFRLAPWVTTEKCRAEHVGALLRCPLCRMPRAPACLEVYRETPVYGAAEVPKGLRASHRLKEGAWARIVVHAGRVLYVLEDEGDFGVMLRAGVEGIVAPGRPHHVRPEPGARLQIRFCRPCTNAP